MITSFKSQLYLGSHDSVKYLKKKKSFSTELRKRDETEHNTTKLNSIGSIILIQLSSPQRTRRLILKNTHHVVSVSPVDEWCPALSLLILKAEHGQSRHNMLQSAPVSNMPGSRVSAKQTDAAPSTTHTHTHTHKRARVSVQCTH